MKRLIYACALICGLSATPAMAYTTYLCVGPVNLITETETAGGTAHVLELNVTSCSGACNISGTRRAYIEFADRAIVAQAMNASTVGGNWAVKMQTDAPSVTTNHGTMTCKVLSLWK